MKTEYLLNREMEKVLGLLTPTNALVMRVSLHTGLRVGDVLALHTADIDRQFYVTESKTGKRRRVNLSMDLVRLMLDQAGDYWVFPARDPATGKHRTRQAVWRDVKRAQRAFRLPENVGCHTARKVYAVELMRQYGDLKRVQRALNHSSPTVTVLYAMADQLLQHRRAPKTRRAW